MLAWIDRVREQVGRLKTREVGRAEMIRYLIRKARALTGDTDGPAAQTFVEQIARGI